MKISSFSEIGDKSVIIDVKSIDKIKHYMYVFLLSSGKSLPVHFYYYNLIESQFFNTNLILFNFNYFLKEITNIMNLIFLSLKNRQMFFYFDPIYLSTEVSSLNKLIFGISNSYRFSFLRGFDLKFFRTHRFKSIFADFVDRFKISITLLPSYSFVWYSAPFFQKLGVTTVGLVCKNVKPDGLDYWLLTNSSGIFSNYLFFSWVYSLYTLSVKVLQNQFLKTFFINFCKMVNLLVF